MPQLQQSALRNHILTRLSPETFEQLAPALSPVRLALRDRLIAAHEPIEHAYFIETGLCSLIANTAEGRIEIGLGGSEGLVGTPLVLGTDRTPHTAMIQAEGTALRIEASALRTALNDSVSLRAMLGRYVQSLIVQVGQTVYANIDLNIEGRLARWILMVHDRLHSDDLPLTHEFLSLMLGVRRPGVTTATHVLEGAGMIKAKRGRIIVLDREKLMELAGDTYGPAEAEGDRLMAET